MVTQAHLEKQFDTGSVSNEFMCLCCFQSLEECESHGLPPTEQGRLDLELKIEDTKENIRKAEVCDSDCRHLFLVAKLFNRINHGGVFPLHWYLVSSDLFWVKSACSLHVQRAFVWVLSSFLPHEMSDEVETLNFV